MAEIMSLIMMVFMVMPVIAPTAGQLILLFAEWRIVFAFMAAVGLIAGLWTALRIPETLDGANRREFNLATILQGFGAVATHRLSLWYTLAAACMFGALFGLVNSAQQIYVGIYGLGVWFPVIFAVVAGVMALSAFLNARIVSRFGMRRISHLAVSGFFLASCLTATLAYLGTIPLPDFVGLLCVCMFQFGFVNSNFRAIAMDPLGKLAGTASSVQGLTQTVGGAAIGAAIGQAFDGTVFPLVAGFALSSCAALVCIAIAEKGKLYTASPEMVVTR
jgi:MFS transporter, DHA1 family, multidrug resistance protein